MRLSDDKIKQGILHPERLVRDAAVNYYSRSYSRDQTVMPVAIQAVEKFGWEDAFTTASAIEGLLLNDDTISWVIGQFGRMDTADNDEWAECCSALSWLLADADAELLSRHASVILDLNDLDYELHDRIAKKLDLLSADTEHCWRELERFCEEAKDEPFVDQVDLSHANALVEAIARCVNSDRVLSLLALEIDDCEGNPQTWMEGFAVKLAGQIRLEPAIPLIVEKSQEDDDAEWLDGLCQEALSRIGTDAVVEAVVEEFSGADLYRRMSICAVLDRIHSDLSVQKCLGLLEAEKDPTLRAMLGQALTGHFAMESIEPVRQMILDGTTDHDFADLRENVLAAATLMDVDVPESEEWKVQIEEERKQRREYFERMIEDDYEDYENENENENDEEYEEPLGRPTPFVGKTKVGRNDPCPCGSGKKFKKCCLRKGNGNGLQDSE